MNRLSREEVASQSGVDPAFVDRLVSQGVLRPDGNGTFATGDVRRTRLIHSLESAGLAVDDVAKTVRRGDLRLEMFDLESFETRFSSLSVRPA